MLDDSASVDYLAKHRDAVALSVKKTEVLKPGQESLLFLPKTVRPTEYLFLQFDKKPNEEIQDYVRALNMAFPNEKVGLLMPAPSSEPQINSIFDAVRDTCQETQVLRISFPHLRSKIKAGQWFLLSNSVQAHA